MSSWKGWGCFRVYRHENSKNRISVLHQRELKRIIQSNMPEDSQEREEAGCLRWSAISWSDIFTHLNAIKERKAPLLQPEHSSGTPKAASASVHILWVYDNCSSVANTSVSAEIFMLLWKWVHCLKRPGRVFTAHLSICVTPQFIHSSGFNGGTTLFIQPGALGQMCPVTLSPPHSHTCTVRHHLTPRCND